MTTVAPNTRTRTTFVYSFDQTAPGGRELLGGKGLGLSEMAHLGVPVPGRVHDHDRRVPRIPDEAATCRSGSRTRSPSTSSGSSSPPARRFGEPVESAAPLGSFGRRDLDAGDDGLDPRSRTERRGGRRASLRATGNARFAQRLLPAPDPDVRRGRRGHRLAPLRARPRRRSSGARRRERRRPRRRRTCSSLIERYKQIYAGGGARLPAGRARAADARRARRVRLLELAARSGVPADLRDSRRSRHRRERDADGVREQRASDCGTGVCFSRDPSTGEARHLRRVSPECAGRGRRRRDPAPRSARRDAHVASRLRSTSSSTRSSGSSGTTATFRTSSSRSSRAGCTSCRPGRRSERRPPPSRPRSRWSRRGC